MIHNQIKLASCSTELIRNLVFWCSVVFLCCASHSNLLGQCGTIQTYCYGESDLTGFIFNPGGPGDIITVDFLAGGLEPGFDNVNVYQGTNNAGILLGSFDDDVTGISVSTITPGSSVFIQFESDFSISCQSGAYPAVTWEITCGAPSGCTNPTACNYDPAAVNDDGSCCFDSCIEVTAGGGTFDGEISWSLFESGTLLLTGVANTPNGQNYCGGDGCYTIELYDSFGDGWNGATMQVQVNGVTVVNTTMATGSFSSASFNIGAVVPGCTDPSAPNYNPLATCDDGSCQPCYDSNPSGCPEIDLGADIVMPSCFDPCAPLTLEADVFDAGQTTSYEVCAIDFNPPYPFNAGTQIFIGLDDIFSPAINLPFDFCFFGQTYDQVVVGANGLITFDLTQADRCCAWAYDSPLPTPSLPYGDTPPACGGSGQDGIYNTSINGAYHDMDPSISGSIYYAIQGSYPCRVFIVNWDQVAHFSCTSITTTQQIVIYETTNTIEVYLADKPTCAGWNNGNAVVGIQDHTGTVGYVPINRQTGSWSATNEAWRFRPNGSPNYVVDWYDEFGAYLGSGTDVEVCPGEDPQTFEAEATYTACDGSTIQVQDDIIVSCLNILLPVEWLNFDAELSPDERKVHCSWTTASETDNDYFMVERSADGENWEDIGQVDGAGTISEARSYQFTDAHPLPGVSYYRVRQTDFNGQSSRSQIDAVERSENDQWVLFPNPGNGTFSVTSTVKQFKLKVYDVRGREVPYSMTPNKEYQLKSAEPGYYTVEFIAKTGDAILKRLPLLVE